MKDTKSFREVNLMKGLRELFIEHKGPETGYMKPSESPLFEYLTHTQFSRLSALLKGYKVRKALRKNEDLI